MFIFSGIHCRRHVTTHGLALNCDIDLNWFDLIIPCGLEGFGVTSISNELEQSVTVKSVSKPLIDSFCNTFNCTVEVISPDSLFQRCGINL